MSPRGRRSRLGLRGFSYPFRGLSFLFAHPRLISYVAVPFGINTLLYTASLWFVWGRFGRWLNHLVPRGEAWYWGFLFYVLASAFAVALGLAVVYTFTLIGNLIAAPFSDLLSAAVEWAYTGSRLEEPFRLKAFGRDLARSLKAEVGRLALYAAGALLLLLLNLAPPFGTAIYAVLMPLYTLFFLGWEYLDYSMERAKLPFSAKRAAAFRNAPAVIAFGGGAAVLLFVPLVNLLAIPVCVIGATLLFCDLRAAGQVPRLHPEGAPPAPRAGKAETGR